MLPYAALLLLSTQKAYPVKFEAEYTTNSVFEVVSLDSVDERLQSVVDRLLIEPVAKAWGHTIAQQLLHGPHMVRQTCRHSRRDSLPLRG